MEIKKIYYIFIAIIPCLALFTPPIIFGILSLICFILLILNFKLMRKIIEYNYNFLIFIFGIFTLIITLINKNYSGLPISIGLNMIILYFMYLRYIMNENFFKLLFSVISIGSIFSYFYTKIGLNNTFTNSLIDYLRSLLHLNFEYFNSDISNSSFFLNRNYFAYIVVLVILLSVFVSSKNLKNIRTDKRCIYSILISLITIFFNIKSLILTESRGAYLALIVGLIILLIMMFNSLTLLIIPIVGVVLININNFITFLPRFDSVISSLQSRLSLWHKGIQYISENPWFGNGFYTLLSKGGIPHSHNIFIETLVCFGLFGLLLIISFVILSLWDKAKEWVNNKNEYFPLVISILMATIIHGFNDMILLSPATIMLFVIIYSMADVKNVELKPLK